MGHYSLMPRGWGRFRRFDVFISVEVETRPAEITSVWTDEEACWHPERLHLLDGVEVDSRDG